MMIKDLSPLQTKLITALACFYHYMEENHNYSFSSGEHEEHVFFMAKEIEKKPYYKNKKEMRDLFNRCAIHVYGEDHECPPESIKVMKLFFMDYLIDYYSYYEETKKNNNYKNSPSDLHKDIGDQLSLYERIKSYLLS